MKRASLALVLSTLTLTSVNAYSAIAPTNQTIGDTSSSFVALVGINDMTAASVSSTEIFTTTATGVFGNIKEIHVLPEAAFVNINPSTGKHIISFMPIFDNQNRLDSLVVNLEVVTGWSALAKEAIRGAFPLATQWKPRAKTSQFSLLTNLGTNNTVLSTVSFPGGSPSQLNTTGVPVPLQIRITKVGLQNLACAIEESRAAAVKERDRRLPATEYTSVVSLMTGSLVQTYSVIDAGDLVTKVDFDHNPPVKLNTPDATAELINATDIVSKALSDLHLECELQPSELQGYAGKIRDYNQSLRD